MLLAAAYSAAAALVYASTAEGFGLPPLEASVCGCEVIAMRTPALTELGGEHFFFLEPADLAGVAQGSSSSGGKDDALSAQEASLMHSFAAHVQQLLHLHTAIGVKGNQQRGLLAHGRRYCGWASLGRAVVGAALAQVADRGL
jgi:glycosyltransferase involved in cell wall biosynthesis